MPPEEREATNRAVGPSAALLCVFQPRQSLGDLGAPAFQFIPLLPLALHHVLRCPGDEIGIAELAIDASDVSRDPGHFLFPARALARDLDAACQRPRPDLPA